MGRTPLHYTIGTGNLEIIKKLIQKGANPFLATIVYIYLNY